MPKSLYIDPVKVREPGYIHFEDIPVCQYNTVSYTHLANIRLTERLS